MRIGVPRETKDGERRVGIVPDGVRALVAAGHEAIVQADAGAASGFADDAYRAAGAVIVDDAAETWRCPLIVKVKEIQRAEVALLTPATTVFGFAQLNRDPALLDAVLAAGVRIIAYETLRDEHGGLPLLAPMSRIAGRLAPFAGAQSLATSSGGNGTLLTGVDDVPPAQVVVVGAGHAGGEAARIALRLGASVRVFSRGAERLAALAAALAQEGRRIDTMQLDGNGEAFAAAIADADLVIGAVLEPGRLSPKLISRTALRSMRRGSALVDIGIDQGGIAQTSRMTSLSQPTYVEEGVVHYAVPNMPALVARTATLALCAATLPYVLRLADAQVTGAVDADASLGGAVMVWDGVVAHPGLARDAGRTQRDRPWRTTASAAARAA
jgi:alanine dehydrogenase